MKKKLSISKSVVSVCIVMLFLLISCSMGQGDFNGPSNGSGEKLLVPAGPGVSKALINEGLLIEAEAFSAQYGIRFEECKDTGGGKNAGWIDVNDWLEYTVTIPEAGDYFVDYRVASQTALGNLQFIANGSVLAQTSIPNTAGWQIWTTERVLVSLERGPQTIRLYATGQQFNLNWFKITRKAPKFGKIEAEEYDAFYDTTGSVGTETCLDTGGGLNVGWIIPGEWLDYNISAPADGVYTMSVRAASKTEPGAFRILIDGNDVSGLVKFAPTGDWQNWQTIPAGTVSLAKGPHVVKIFFETKDMNINYLEFTGNQKPTVSITKPLNGVLFTTGDAVSIEAAASDADGTVSRVDFFVQTTTSDRTLIGSDTSAPFQTGWTADRQGEIELVAVAADNLGQTSDESVVNITVSGDGEWIKHEDNNASLAIVENSSADVTLHFPDAGYRIKNWGEVTFEGNNLSVHIEVEAWTGYSAQVLTDLKNSYDFSSLPLTPGEEYTFTVKTWGRAITSKIFTPQWPGFVIPGKIEAEEYDAYYDTTPGNTGGAYKNDDVDISVCSDGGFNVGWIAQGEWLDYNVYVKRAGDYLVKYRVASETYNGKIQIQVDGTVLAATTVINTKNWQGWTDVYANIHLAAGPQTIRLFAEGFDFNLDWFEISDNLSNVVTVNGRQIMVNGKPFQIKGVCWSPTPVGVRPVPGGVADYSPYVERDAALMRAAGINTIRTYVRITDRKVLDTLYENGIYVINSIYINLADDDDLASAINAVKDHPAILMWGIGNEWNYNFLYASETGQYLTFDQTLGRLNDMADLIKTVDTTHPVLTTYGGKLPDDWVIKAMPNIDIWGLQIYNGLSFLNAFEDWKKSSTKPMFLSEYGADAWNSNSSRVDEDSQALATRVLTNLILENSSAENRDNTCSGGTIFEWSDEWWKAPGSPYTHDTGGNAPGFGPYPDTTFNEEYWGIVDIDRTQRSAYHELKALYNP